MDTVLAKLDELQEHAIKLLGTAVEIPSVSNDPTLRKEVFRMAEFLEKEFDSLNILHKREFLDPEAKIDDSAPAFPPVLFAETVPVGSGLPSVLIYGHYDVQPAEEGDGWKLPPFKFHHDEQKGIMYGRGATDDKGPVLGWLHVIRAYKAAKVPLPVRLVFCLEGLEEVGSTGLRSILRREIEKGSRGYLHGIDVVSISDTYWTGTSKPCLGYGLRGISYFTIQVSAGGDGKDKHSGYGGQIKEPLQDLVKLFSSLTDDAGDIAIPGFSALEKPLRPEVKALYEGIETENKLSKHETAVQTLIAGWYDSALSYHGIEGAFSGPGAKTVIPGSVIGKFSLRTQSGIDLSAVTKIVKEHLDAVYRKLKTKNIMKVECLGSEPGWESDPLHWNYDAASKAIEKVWGVKPDYTREGGTIPITGMLQDILAGKNIVLIPMGRVDDGAHSADEKLDLTNYANGCKVFAWYLEEIGNRGDNHALDTHSRHIE
ncbi:putative glutamate carboxypeptidase [Bisporella sp. PMI_857]|nr:putative glutamate carboxypeptidase [Bisporella sp. PMI_857]